VTNLFVVGCDASQQKLAAEALTVIGLELHQFPRSRTKCCASDYIAHLSKYLSRWRLADSQWLGITSIAEKTPSPVTVKAKIHYTSFPVASPQQVCNKLSRAKVPCVCWLVSLPKFNLQRHNRLVANLLRTCWRHFGMFLWHGISLSAVISELDFLICLLLHCGPCNNFVI